MSQMLPTTRHSIRLAQRTNIAVLVGLSRLLRHLKPHRLQRLMSLVVRGAQPADYNIARDARDDILSASAVCRGDRACLIRSVAAMLLCRQRGYAPTWCVGVVATPPPSPPTPGSRPTIASSMSPSTLRTCGLSTAWAPPPRRDRPVSTAPS